MDSKLSSLIGVFKNFNSDKIMDTLKKNQENLNPKVVMDMARKAVDTARSFSKDEIQMLRDKISDVGNKTQFEIEKNVGKIVDQILSGQPKNMATPDIRDEIVQGLRMSSLGLKFLATV